MNKIIVEFSLSQKAFHSHTVMDMLKENIQTVMARHQSDFLPIGIFDTKAQADIFIEQYYEMLKDYPFYYNNRGELIVTA